ncbi:alpha-glucosidase [Bacillus sp. 03113]|uniref:glycoside hydrolase family 13 protein n=1 Tax=Bacillus sp. 03113 TaxID=2578211 RepID=UPI00114508EF|nr:alpha-glucosidase [Bacillus sp. 03113]
MNAEVRKWWKESVVYQIYPRSFMDSNGDGIGDLQGIISKLDYLKELGIDVIWLSPVYKSPNDDNGYDISDYQDIMNEFGTMQDWELLLQGLHERGMKLMMDLVVNHTSDEHKWFIESRSSKNHPKRDYYIWRQAKDGKEPNNWASFFSGSAWEFDEKTEEFYLHCFSKKQPDLNWENVEVRQEIYSMMKWWLDKGVDGFRMDVINLLSKVPGLPDSPNPNGTKYATGGQGFLNGPRIHEFLQEMQKEVLSKYDIMTVGEMPGVTTEDALLYTGEDRKELNMIFQFEHLGFSSELGGKWETHRLPLSFIKSNLSKWQIELNGKGWNSLYFSNHDVPRQVSRFGDDKKYRTQSAKMLATVCHMMQGTPYIYQGEEIGMTNVHFPTIEEYKDIETLNMYKEKRSEGVPHDIIMESIYVKGRDNARTPFQWDDSENAGFTSGNPWINVNPNYEEINAAQCLEDPNSIFHYYRKLIQLRKEHDIVVYGDYQLILDDHEQIFSYIRTLGNETLLVICNFSKETPTFYLPSTIIYDKKERLISNYKEIEPDEISVILLQPYEARVYKLTTLS